MNNAATADNWITELFGIDTRTAEEIEAGMQAARAAEAARVAAVLADRAAAARAKIENACPRCSGRGYLPQFQHRKGGECFACGATGVFTRLAA